MANTQNFTNLDSLIKLLNSQNSADVVQAIRYLRNSGKDSLMIVLRSESALNARLFRFFTQTSFELPDGSQPPPPELEQPEIDKKSSKSKEPLPPAVSEPYEWVKPIWIELLLFLESTIQITDGNDNSLASSSWDPSWIQFVTSLLLHFRTNFNVFLDAIVPEKMSRLSLDESTKSSPSATPEPSVSPVNSKAPTPPSPISYTQVKTQAAHEKYTYQPRFQRSLSPNVKQLYDVLISFLANWSEAEAYNSILEGWIRDNSSPTLPYLKEITTLTPLCSGGIVPDLLRLTIYMMKIVYKTCDHKTIRTHPAVEETFNSLQFFSMKQSPSPSQPLSITLAVLSLVAASREFAPSPQLLHNLIMSLSNALPSFSSTALPSQALLTITSRLFINTSGGPILKSFQNFLLFVSIFALVYSNSLSLFFHQDKETVFRILTQFVFTHIDFRAPIPGFNSQQQQNLPKGGAEIIQMLQRRHLPDKLAVPPLPKKPEEAGIICDWMRDFILAFAPLNQDHFGGFMCIFATLIIRRAYKFNLSVFISKLSEPQNIGTPSIVNALTVITLFTRSQHQSQALLISTLSQVPALSQRILSLALIPTVPAASISLFTPYISDWLLKTPRIRKLDEATRIGSMGKALVPPSSSPPFLHLSTAVILSLIGQAEKQNKWSPILATMLSTLEKCKSAGWNFTDQMHLSRTRTLVGMFNSEDPLQKDIISHATFAFQTIPSPVELSRQTPAVRTVKNLSETAAVIRKATATLGSGQPLSASPASFPTTSTERKTIFDSAFHSSQFRTSQADQNFVESVPDQLLTSSTCSTPIDVICRHTIIPTENKIAIRVALMNTSRFAFSGLVVRALPSSPCLVLPQTPHSAIRAIPFLDSNGGCSAVTFVFTVTAALHDANVSFLVGVHSATHTKEEAMQLFSLNAVDINSPSASASRSTVDLTAASTSLYLPVPTIHFHTMAYRIPPQTFFVPIPLSSKAFNTLFWTLPVSYRCTRCVCTDTRSFAETMRRCRFYSLPLRANKIYVKKGDNDDSDEEDETMKKLFQRKLPALLRISRGGADGNEEEEEEEEEDEDEEEDVTRDVANIFFSRAFATTSWMQDIFLCVITGRAPKPTATSSLSPTHPLSFDQISVPHPSVDTTNLPQALFDTSFTLQRHTPSTPGFSASSKNTLPKPWTVRIVCRGRSDKALAEGLRLLEDAGCFSTESKPLDLSL